MSPQTFIYKTIGTLSLSVDVHLPSTSAAEAAAQSNDTPPALLPILIWFHGGGLLMGHRGSIAPHLQRAVEKERMCLVSVDYRLAPQAGVDDIMEDVQDAGAWVQSSLDAVLGGGVVDVARVVVGGGSAGGYLALLAGSPTVGMAVKPRAILAIYPITNPSGPFFKTRQVPTVGTNGRTIEHVEMMDHIDPSAEVLGRYQFVQPIPAGDRGEIYSYMCQEAILQDLLFCNSAPGTDVQNYIPANFVAKDSPPTYIFHGDIDNRVGIEQSHSLVEAMKTAGTIYDFEECVGGGQHLFDYEEGVQMERMYEFLRKYL